MDGQVSGLGTVHPLLTFDFISTWILPLHVVFSSLSAMDGLQGRRIMFVTTCRTTLHGLTVMFGTTCRTTLHGLTIMFGTTCRTTLRGLTIMFGTTYRTILQGLTVMFGTTYKTALRHYWASLSYVGQHVAQHYNTTGPHYHVWENYITTLALILHSTQ